MQAKGGNLPLIFSNGGKREILLAEGSSNMEQFQPRKKRSGLLLWDEK